MFSAHITDQDGNAVEDCPNNRRLDPEDTP
jgi:hypothetical protein